jgi:hypothetical protein
MGSSDLPVRNNSVATGGGRHGVYGDTAGAEFLRQNMSHRFDRRLGGRVNSVGGKVVADDARRKIDDATSIPHSLGAFRHSVDMARLVAVATHRLARFFRGLSKPSCTIFSGMVGLTLLVWPTAPALVF